MIIKLKAGFGIFSEYIFDKRKGIIMPYYEKLKKIRIDKSESQKDIAEILETTRQQISKYETGVNEMTVGKLRILCLHYGVSADCILELPENLKRSIE